MVNSDREAMRSGMTPEKVAALRAFATRHERLLKKRIFTVPNAGSGRAVRRRLKEQLAVCQAILKEYA